MEYRYGSKADEVDPFFAQKRTWSTVKDKIVGKYLDAYLRTVHSLGRSILIVDGFSGPGIFGDDTDGSPRIICRVAQANQHGVPIRCLFADIRAAHRAALEACLAREISSGLAELPLSDCAAALDNALERYPNATIFFYLDPYGIRDLEFDTISRIFERMQRSSTEILMNFSFRAFMRLSGNWGYADSAFDVAAKVKGGKVETVNRVMGGEYWKDIICDASLSKIAREDAVISAYLERIRRVCPFAYAVPVKEPQDEAPGLPADELAHYHLIFATRSARAIVYMNDIGLEALQPYFEQFREGFAGGGSQARLFDVTPERYRRVEDDAAKAAIVEITTERPLTREQIYEEVIPRFFMQHKKKIYRAWIDDLFRAGRLYADPSEPLSRNRLNDKVRLSAKPWRS